MDANGRRCRAGEGDRKGNGHSPQRSLSPPGAGRDGGRRRRPSHAENAEKTNAEKKIGRLRRDLTPLAPSPGLEGDGRESEVEDEGNGMCAFGAWESGALQRRVNLRAAVHRGKRRGGGGTGTSPPCPLSKFGEGDGRESEERPEIGWLRQQATEAARR
jgi:hypothetical protein